MQLANDTSVIDFHSHFLVQEVFDQCHSHSPASGFGHHQAPAHLVSLFEKMKNPRLAIEDMDHLKIDMSVFSSATVIEPTSWAEPAVELELVRRLNDTIAEWAAHSPRRIIGSFAPPLQDMDLALQELTRALDLGSGWQTFRLRCAVSILETASFGRSGRRRRTSVWCPSCTRKEGSAHGFSNSACGTRSLNR